jgi:cytochrome c oxidase assembly protein Cox11
MNTILPLAFDEDMITPATELLIKHGVNIRTNTMVEKILGENGAVSGVQLKNGEIITADRIIMAIGYKPNITLAKKCGVKIGIYGSIVTDEYLRTSIDDIYAVGQTTGVNVAFDTATEAQDANISSPRTIDGSEINVSFDKSDIDEAKPDAEDILVGNLNLLATTDDYEVKTITVDVTTTGMTDAEIVAAVEELELDGTTFDSVSGTTYTFEDIVLSAGEELELPLTFKVADDFDLIGQSLNFDLNITEIEDTEENDTYTVGAAPLLSSILSSTAFDDKDIDIESASFEMTDVAITDRDLVL